jgi:polysaccharide export outer membrane protein
MAINSKVYRSLVMAACLPVLALAGCADSPDPVLTLPANAPEQASANARFSGDVNATAVLRPMDEVSMQVLGEPEYSIQSVKIAPDGYIDLPAAGRIKAAGRTPAELSVASAQALSRYLVAPKVSVNVIDFGSHKVTVEGSVNDPGVFAFAPDTTLLGAIALANGATRVAKLDQIAIFRNDDGQRMVAVFDLKKVRSGELVDPVLHPGDKVVVGFSGLAQAEQDFLQAVPLIAIFTRL